MEQFVARQKALLALEREAELAEAALLLERVPLRELCQRGLALQRLAVAGMRTGLYGRTLVTFVAGGAELPAHTITSGDIVGLREQEQFACSFYHYKVFFLTMSYSSTSTGTCARYRTY
jgi:DNA polymerase alpha-associated DNA helicase A